MPDDQAGPTPQPRTRRDQGRENMVVATVALLRERGPEHVTVRDVAEASGHHHRFVQAWFGGKVALFRAAFDRMLEERATSMDEGLAIVAFDDDLVTIVGLMNWLIAADPTALDGPRATPILDRMVEVYRNDFGLDGATARLMALRMISATIAGILFPGALGIEGDDISDIAMLEREMASLLAKARANDS